MSQPKVTVYSAEWCPWCKLTKQWLDKHSIQYTEIDIDKSPKAAEEVVEKSGQEGIPVIDIDGNIVVGFNEPALKKLLGIK